MSELEPLPRSMVVGSWNVLSDYDLLRNPGAYSPQKDRVEEIGAYIEGLEPSPALIFLHEGVSSEMLEIITGISGYESISKPRCYSKDEWMTVAIRPDIEVGGVVFDSRSRSIRAMVNDLCVIGHHQPHRLIMHAPQRLASGRNLRDLAIGNQPAIIIGDFNAPHWLVSRRFMSKLQEAHADKRPKFPVDKFHGVTYPRRLPRFNIDAMYATEGVDIEWCSSETTDLSDHPMLTAKFTY